MTNKKVDFGTRVADSHDPNKWAFSRPSYCEKHKQFKGLIVFNSVVRYAQDIAKDENFKTEIFINGKNIAKEKIYGCLVCIGEGLKMTNMSSSSQRISRSETSASFGKSEKLPEEVLYKSKGKNNMQVKLIGKPMKTLDQRIEELEIIANSGVSIYGADERRIAVAAMEIIKEQRDIIEKLQNQLEEDFDEDDWSPYWSNE